MSLHPELPSSPYQTLPPEQRWFPADESLRDASYERLVPPLVANIRREAQDRFEQHEPQSFAGLVTSFREYKDSP